MIHPDYYAPQNAENGHSNTSHAVRRPQVKRMWVVRGDGVRKKSIANDAPPSSKEKMVKGLSAMRKDGKFADFTVFCEEHEFRVHQLVLAASSEFFEHLFNVGMKETVSSSVILLDHREEVISAMLDFCYEAEVNVPAEFKDLDQQISTMEETPRTSVPSSFQRHPIRVTNPRPAARTAVAPYMAQFRQAALTNQAYLPPPPPSTLVNPLMLGIAPSTYPTVTVDPSTGSNAAEVPIVEYPMDIQAGMKVEQASKSAHGRLVQDFAVFLADLYIAADQYQIKGLREVICEKIDGLLLQNLYDLSPRVTLTLLKKFYCVTLQAHKPIRRVLVNHVLQSDLEALSVNEATEQLFTDFPQILIDVFKQLAADVKPTVVSCDPEGGSRHMVLAKAIVQQGCLGSCDYWSHDYADHQQERIVRSFYPGVKAYLGGEFHRLIDRAVIDKEATDDNTS